MRMDVSNCIEKEKLKYNDIHDLVLAEDVRRKDSDELLGLGSTLNVDNQGKCNRRDAKGSNRSRSKSKNRGKIKLYS